MENKFEELKELAKPLQEWLLTNYNPMCSIVIENDRITVVSKEMATSTEKVSQ